MGKHWYTKFVPELREIADKALASGDAEKMKGGKALQAAIDEMLASKPHAWFTGNMPKAEQAKRRKAQEEFKRRYENR